MTTTRGDVTRAGERGGAISALAVTVGIPILLYWLYFCVAFNDGDLIPGSGADWPGFLTAIRPTAEVALVYAAWLGLQVLLFIALPGRVIEGLPLEDGSRLHYKINGLGAIVISLGLLGAGQASGWLSLSWIHDNFGALLSVVTVFSFVFGLFLYYWGRTRPGGPVRVTGNFIVDYFYGTALNPRVPPVTGLDLKFFFESRPGLIGWVVVIIGLAEVQWQRDGHLSPSMWLVVAMQSLYVASSFVFERNMLTMIDIRTERFGWMLLYGDAAFVPMSYSLQAFYLIDHVPDLPVWMVAIVLLLFFTGFFIFRSANGQKDRFRRDPEHTRIWGKPARYLTTSNGSRLLVSGFWGLARHPNYLGDALIALAFSLPTLFGSIVPYFYPLFLWSLLISRERRDDRWCAQKYGDDWITYRQRVPYRIVPRLY